MKATEKARIAKKVSMHELSRMTLGTSQRNRKMKIIRQCADRIFPLLVPRLYFYLPCMHLCPRQCADRSSSLLVPWLYFYLPCMHLCPPFYSLSIHPGDTRSGATMEGC